jgi:biopolymer transport protein ExbB
MIHTFELITFHGTGDPRMLSSGISEALVTTMFGLGVAIPVMLAHSLISRRVESRIADLEEKAISFVNRVTKARQVEKQPERVATEHN